MKDWILAFVLFVILSTAAILFISFLVGVYEDVPKDSVRYTIYNQDGEVVFDEVASKTYSTSGDTIQLFYGGGKSKRIKLGDGWYVESQFVNGGEK